MALILGYLYDGYNFLFNEFKDPRVEHYPFLGSPFPVAGLVIFYVYFVQILGPRLMRDRKPIELPNFIMVYNLLQVLMNLVVATAALYYSYWAGQMKVLCTPINYSETPEMLNLVLITYIFFLMKITDVMDTMFFVLRKRNNQITFLHVYHHGGMIVGSYTVAKFVAGSHATMLGIINMYVHVIMYGYYFLTSLRPELKASIWWKKHITQLQLLQFTLLIIHFGHPILLTECGYPKALNFIGMSQNLFMFLLFSDFYYKAYIRRPATATNGVHKAKELPNKTNGVKTVTTNGEAKASLSNGNGTHAEYKIKAL